MAAIAGMTRIITVWLALRETTPQDRPAILGATAGLWTPKRIELHAPAAGPGLKSSARN